MLMVKRIKVESLVNYIANHELATGIVIHNEDTYSVD